MAQEAEQEAESLALELMANADASLEVRCPVMPSSASNIAQHGRTAFLVMHMAAPMAEPIPSWLHLALRGSFLLAAASSKFPYVGRNDCSSV